MGAWFANVQGVLSADRLFQSQSALLGAANGIFLSVPVFLSRDYKRTAKIRVSLFGHPNCFLKPLSCYNLECLFWGLKDTAMAVITRSLLLQNIDLSYTQIFLKFVENLKLWIFAFVTSRYRHFWKTQHISSTVIIEVLCLEALAMIKLQILILIWKGAGSSESARWSFRIRYFL